MIKEYERIHKELSTALIEQQLAFTTDMWTDSYTQRSFVSLSAHYICAEFKLNVKILGVKEFEAEKKTGANILLHVTDILKQFNIDNKLINSVIVTDNGANVVSAFNNFKRLSCACHNLNLLMTDVLEKDPIYEIRQLIDASKKLVKYFKHSELNNKLSKSLKQDVQTRWNSVYIMLQSIFDVKDEIKYLLSEKNQSNRIADIDFEIINQVLEFLKPFKECSEKFSSEKEPTIHIYVLWYNKLKSHCNQKMLDSFVISQLKTNTLLQLDKRLKPTNLHYVGLFLNPPFRQLNFLTETERNDTFATIKGILSEYSIENTSPEKSTSANEAQDFFEFRDETNAKKVKLVRSAVDIEIDNYYKCGKENENNVLEFWRNANNLKCLQKLAKQILNIPISSATSERVFSTSGMVLCERRTRLLSSNLDKLVFLYKNMN